VGAAARLSDCHLARLFPALRVGCLRLFKASLDNTWGAPKCDALWELVRLCIDLLCGTRSVVLSSACQADYMHRPAVRVQDTINAARARWGIHSRATPSSPLDPQHHAMHAQCTRRAPDQVKGEDRGGGADQGQRHVPGLQAHHRAIRALMITGWLAGWGGWGVGCEGRWGLLSGARCCWSTGRWCWKYACRCLETVDCFEVCFALGVKGVLLFTSGVGLKWGCRVFELRIEEPCYLGWMLQLQTSASNLCGCLGETN